MGFFEEGVVVGVYEIEREYGVVDGGVVERDVGYVVRDDFGSVFWGL